MFANIYRGGDEDHKGVDYFERRRSTKKMYCLYIMGNNIFAFMWVHLCVVCVKCAFFRM